MILLVKLIFSFQIYIHAHVNGIVYITSKVASARYTTFFLFFSKMDIQNEKETKKKKNARLKIKWFITQNVTKQVILLYKIINNNSYIVVCYYIHVRTKKKKKIIFVPIIYSYVFLILFKQIP